MKLTYEIIVNILTTHYVDSIIIGGRIIALDQHNAGYDCVDITDWSLSRIKYDLLGY